MAKFPKSKIKRTGIVVVGGGGVTHAFSPCLLSTMYHPNCDPKAHRKASEGGRNEEKARGPCSCARCFRRKFPTHYPVFQKKKTKKVFSGKTVYKHGFPQFSLEKLFKYAVSQEKARACQTMFLLPQDVLTRKFPVLHAGSPRRSRSSTSTRSLQHFSSVQQFGGMVQRSLSHRIAIAPQRAVARHSGHLLLCALCYLLPCHLDPFPEHMGIRQRSVLFCRYVTTVASNHYHHQHHQADSWTICLLWFKLEGVWRTIPFVNVFLCLRIRGCFRKSSR